MIVKKYVVYEKNNCNLSDQFCTWYDIYALYQQSLYCSHFHWTVIVSGLLSAFFPYMLTKVPMPAVYDYGNRQHDRIDMRITGMDSAEEWLHHESMRLEELRRELNQASHIMKQEAMKLQNEKKEFEMQRQDFLADKAEWERQADAEKKKIADEAALFDKKYKVLEMGFAKLDADRKAFEAQKRAFSFRQKYEQESAAMTDDDLEKAASEMYFFRGVTHILALKKRYKDLIKIYHPDNLDGDKSALQQINREYEQLKRIINCQRKA